MIRNTVVICEFYIEYKLISNFLVPSYMSQEHLIIEWSSLFVYQFKDEKGILSFKLVLDTPCKFFETCRYIFMQENDLITCLVFILLERFNVVLIKKKKLIVS